MNANPPDLRLRIGANVHLLREGREVPLSPLQQSYLLLVAHGGEEGVGRADLIRLLWGSGEDPATRHRVRQLTYGVGRKAGRSLVEAHGRLLQLADSVAVEWTLEPFGAALPVPTPAYHDHLAEMREVRDRGAERGAVRRLDSARLADLPDEVIQVLREGHRTSGSWRDLLWALLRTGRMREAEYELMRWLGDDLPAEGLPTARRMAAETDQILSLAAAGGDASLPLLGRDEDVRQLGAHLVAGARSILVTGVRGVGRSRILGQAVATLLSNQDDLVILGAAGVAFERHSPFAGLGQLLDDEVLIQAFTELGQPETEVIRRALPVQFVSNESQFLAQLGGPGSYLRVAQAVGELFHKAFGEAEVLLVIDDMENLDRSSLEVVARLPSTCGARILATWCTEGERARTELLFRFQGLEPQVLPLRDLALADAVRLCQAVAPDLGAREAEDIARLSGGRPGRIVELIRALKGSPLLSGPMVPSVDELLRRRLRDLPEVEQQTLVYMAVNGGRMDIPTLGSLLDTPVLETSGHLRSLEEAGLVRLEATRPAVVPGLVSEFVMRELPDATRREIHATLADKLVELQGERVDPGSIGHHLHESGQQREGRAWFRRAGLAAQERTAYAEAITYLERSLVGVDHADPDIAKALGSLHAGMGDFRQSIHWYGKARIGYVDRGDEAGDVEAAILSSQSSLELESDRNRLAGKVTNLYDEARRIGESRLVADAVDLLLTIADYGHDRDLLESAKEKLDFELTTRPGDPWIAMVGTRYTYLGDPDLAYRLARTAYLKLRHMPSARGKALRRLIICLYTQMKPRGMRTQVLLSEAERLALSTGDLYTRYAQLSNRALWSMDCGEWDEAERLFGLAGRFIGGPHSVAARRLSVNRALFELRRGNHRAAERYLNQFDESIPCQQSSLTALHAACHLLIHIEHGRMSDAARMTRKLELIDLS
ncbi:MAG: AAA family ATPase, partial [Longimicrobiales bacterium]|nr:AAA family ATPase [Longimicrobiales bacterium]